MRSCSTVSLMLHGGCEGVPPAGVLTASLLPRFFPIWFRDGLRLGPVAASILQGLSPASIAILSIAAQRISMRIGACWLCNAVDPRTA